jgi:hypothetical protein
MTPATNPPTSIPIRTPTKGSNKPRGTPINGNVLLNVQSLSLFCGLKRQIYKICSALYLHKLDKKTRRAVLVAYGVA